MNEEICRLAVELRHELHAHPELSNHESWTKEHLMDFLRRHTSRLKLVDRGRWFYAVWHAGAGKPSVAFRADFDAVPVEDVCEMPYVSQCPGVGHKCGHDGHSAALAALALEIDRDGADKNVYFLFQHAEETGDGAKECAAMLKEEQIDEIFGFHNRPGLPLGMVQVLDGCVYCASEGMILSFQGVPSHASMPELGRNPAYAISDIIQALPGFTDPAKHKGMVFATIIQVDVGEPAFGTQASRGKLLLTIRGQLAEELNALRAAIRGLAEEKAEQYGLKLEVSFRDVFPDTVSHKSSNDKVRRCCEELGIPWREMPAPFRSSEDFGWYTKLIPGAFFEIGGGEGGDLHTVHMNFNDAIIPVAVRLYRRLIETC
jgi:amidohydrolase